MTINAWQKWSLFITVCFSIVKGIINFKYYFYFNLNHDEFDIVKFNQRSNFEALMEIVFCNIKHTYQKQI